MRPWWWSSGQRARLLLRQSEFDSRCSLQFYCKIVVEKNKNKQKEVGVGPFKKHLDIETNLVLLRTSHSRSKQFSLAKSFANSDDTWPV